MTRKERIAQLDGQKQDKIREIGEVIDLGAKDKRSLTAEELGRIEALEAAVSEISGTISAEDKQGEREEDEGRSADPARRPHSDPEAVHPSRAVTPILDLSAKDVAKYSLMRAIRAKVDQDWRGAGFERECHEELEKRTGKGARGILVPMQALYRSRAHMLAETRAPIGKVVDTAGAAVVATDLLADSFIEFLRPNSIAVALGARVLDGLVGDVDIPRQDTGGAATWIVENDPALDSPLSTDPVAARAKTLGLFADMTRKMLKQSTPAMEGLIQSDIRMAIGQGLDQAIFTGSGTGEIPLGITAQTGIGSQTGGMTWDNVTLAEADLADANALRGSLAWVMNPTYMATAKNTTKDTGSGMFIWDADGVNGYPAVPSTFLPAPVTTAAAGLFGNFAEVLIFIWDALDLFSDPYTIGDTGGIRIRGFLDADTNVRHVESFSTVSES